MGSKELPTLFGGILALAALGAGLINQVDANQCLLRSAIAYVVGYFVGTLWNIFFTGGSLAKREVRQAELEEAPPDDESKAA